MTGFGRAEGVANERKITVEVRSLNSKQLDLMLKVPASYKEREVELRQWAGESVMRGKAELVIGCEQHPNAQRTSFDRELLRAYYLELQAIAADVAPGAGTDLFAHALRMPDVSSTTNERLDEQEWLTVSELVRRALKEHDGFRLSEGRRLREELEARVAQISGLLDQVETLDQGRTDRTRDRLRAKLNDLHVAVDADRFEQELVYYLEKLDITEEKVRLRSHCTYFIETLLSDEHQGRKLGFIGQEMGREINTLGSKANDPVIQRLVVQMKDELEKIKEQVLNVL
jgi:uncharacterized protein (TIGR00255 family)